MAVSSTSLATFRTLCVTGALERHQDRALFLLEAAGSDGLTDRELHRFHGAERHDTSAAARNHLYREGDVVWTPETRQWNRHECTVWRHRDFLKPGDMFKAQRPTPAEKLKMIHNAVEFDDSGWVAKSKIREILEQN